MTVFADDEEYLYDLPNYIFLLWTAQDQAAAQGTQLLRWEYQTICEETVLLFEEILVEQRPQADS